MNNRLLLLFLLLPLAGLFAQRGPVVRLRTGDLQPEALADSSIERFFRTAPQHEGKIYGLLQLNALPTVETRAKLAAAGVELLQYLPEAAYSARLSRPLTAAQLKGMDVRALVSLPPRRKMDPFLASGRLPAWAVRQAGSVDVLVELAPGVSASSVVPLLADRGLRVIGTGLATFGILKLRISTDMLDVLAGLAFIDYVQSAPPPDAPLNAGSRGLSRASSLNAATADGGRGLNGEGVTVGIGDNADAQFHIDFSGRLVNRSAGPVTSHGVHTTGTMAGAGNVNEFYRGYAPKATIVSQQFSGILTEAATYVQDNGMVLTNNSYGNIIECDYDGVYDLYARLLDQQAFDIPALLHVFAAGNSGASTCLPFPAGFHTVLGGYQSAKNIITVGGTTDSGTIGSFSSRGPVSDGRMKPEIVATGQTVVSATPPNGYGTITGTSMAAPAITGGLALLCQRYRQLHGGANPPGALIKALACNGASDRGNAGPDYSYGFGHLNLVRSVEMLEANNYVQATVVTGGRNTTRITVPPNTARLNILLYWHDPAASPLSSRTLVNDLDLSVTTPGGATVLPRSLDTSAARLDSDALPRADHVNNAEQVVIDNPAAGEYIVSVSGTTIGQGTSQDYVVTYDPVPVSLRLAYPVGGEGLAPGDRVKIQWDAFGMEPATFRVEQSSNGGGSWTLLASGLAAARRVLTWIVPSTPTASALVRIVNEATGATSTSRAFVIAALPVLSLDPVQCEGYLALRWTAVAGATDYEVMWLRGDSMQPVTTTTALTYTFSGLSPDSVYWVTVRPRINGRPGRRAIAISRQPDTGTCAGSISDGDLRLAAIPGLSSGRRLTSNALTNATPVTVRVRNLDDSPITGFAASYSINGASPVTEAVPVTMAAGSTYTYVFAAPADLSVPGTYRIAVTVRSNGTDPVAANDTLSVVARQLDNPPVSLASPLRDDLEGLPVATITTDTLGIAGASRYDFGRTTTFGRLRTFVNTGFAFSGTRALTLDMDRLSAAGSVSWLYGTYNLSAYDAATTDARLDFMFLNHGQAPSGYNRVWIRGSDTQPWIEAFDLDTHGEPGTYKQSPSIEIARLLRTNGQNFSSSFGVRWGQWGQLPATARESGAGVTIDDIRLYAVSNDVQLLAITAPGSAGCGLSAATPVTVSVRNAGGATAGPVPVRYRVNGGPWIVEAMPPMAAGSTINYSFTAAANLVAYGSYSIEAVADAPGDSFHQNDTGRLAVFNAPLVNQFPYLENFEAGTGYWLAGGRNSSWEFGQPASRHMATAASGRKAWKTRLAGNYNDGERSYLQSPCFDITGLVRPTLSFSVALDIEDCGATLCDGAWVEYSSDGISWTKLGVPGTGTNWYNKTTDKVWSVQGYTRWHVATVPLPTGLPRLMLRFVMSADAGVNREGMAVDDIHIYDNAKGIYDGPTLGTPVVTTVSGVGWVDVESGGKLIASLRPRGQSPGATAVQAFVDTSTSRWANNQYYHPRSLTVKPANRQTVDSVAVRFYFTDRESEKLLVATGCATCSRPSSA
ncbi:MAG: family serine peptidase, partial [Flaviaesturariibacter sp.]|nr:family serine peptidase [Flaviaesturariibacter sp.]